jgi:hypothetical protein
VLLPVIARYRDRDIPKYFRGDSAFALPKLLRLLEREGFRYAIRLKANAVLERTIGPLLARPAGRPSLRPQVFYQGFRYRAGSWEQSRRVVAKVEWHAGELFPRVGFVVTNLTGPWEEVVRFYNRRGTAEQWIKEGKNAVQWTKLSCRRFKDNAARLQLFALAYNLANFLRQLVLPKPVRAWTLTTLREKLIKVGAKVVRHARSVVFNWRKSPSRVRCSRRCYAGSGGCDWPAPRGERCRPEEPIRSEVAGCPWCAEWSVSAVSKAAERPGRVCRNHRQVVGRSARQENRCRRPFAGVASTVEVGYAVPEGVHPGKIGLTSWCCCGPAGIYPARSRECSERLPTLCCRQPVRTSMPLQLRTQKFHIEEATLGAALFRPYWKKHDVTLIDGLWWGLDFECSEKEFLGESCEPHFTFDHFRLPIDCWFDLEGLATTLKGGRCYFIGHDDVGQTKVQVGARTGSRFQFACEGVCDVNWEEPFGRKVPFTITTKVQFDGIRVVGTFKDNDETLCEFLKTHFRLDGLREEPCQEVERSAGSRQSKMIEKMFLPMPRRANLKRG